MADVDFDDYGSFAPSYSPAAEGAGARTLRIQRIVNGAGAAVSVALILGLGVWGYKLAVRDVMGVPVVRALEGPARVAPSDPGGDLARHQGLAVNAIAAEGAAAAPADRLVLAPRPTELTEADQPMAALTVAAPGIVADPEAAPAEVLPAALPAPDATLGTDVAEADLAATALAAPDTPIASEVPGVAVSPRPLSRPSALPAGTVALDTALTGDDPEADAIAAAAAAAVAAALGVEAASVTEVEVDVAGLAAGTRLAQLGAFATAEEARAEWDQAAAALGPLMTGKRRVIETAESGGRTFYRLRVEGFADLEDTRRFCAELKAEGRLCTPTQVQG